MEGLEGRVKEVLEKYREGGEEARGWCGEELRRVLGPEAKDPFVAAVEETDALALDEAARRLVHEFRPEPVPKLAWLEEWEGKDLPRPVIWRDPGEDEDARADPDRVASVGTVAVLGGAGKGGKSWLCTGLAVAAAKAAREGRAYGKACGLRVRAGRTVIVSYEDEPVWVLDRARRMGGAGGGVAVFDQAQPIYGQEPRSGRWRPTGHWRGVWRQVREVEPILVVIDTGAKGMGGETMEPRGVMGFLQRVQEEAAAGGFGALVTAHDTKAARMAIVRGGAAGTDPGAVAGSGQWLDSMRGGLHLAKMGGGDAPRILEAVKSTYSRDGWGAVLRVRYVEGARGERVYAGLELERRVSEAEMAKVRKELGGAKGAGKAEGGGEGGRGERGERRRNRYENWT